MVRLCYNKSLKNNKSHESDKEVKKMNFFTKKELETRFETGSELDRIQLMKELDALSKTCEAFKKAHKDDILKIDQDVLEANGVVLTYVSPSTRLSATAFKKNNSKLYNELVKKYPQKIGDSIRITYNKGAKYR